MTKKAEQLLKAIPEVYVNPDLSLGEKLYETGRIIGYATAALKADLIEAIELTEVEKDCWQLKQVLLTELKNVKG